VIDIDARLDLAKERDEQERAEKREKRNQKRRKQLDPVELAEARLKSEMGED
jgi:U4/U6.U5 tri-snRNP component SNU23